MSLRGSGPANTINSKTRSAFSRRLKPASAAAAPPSRSVPSSTTPLEYGTGALAFQCEAATSKQNVPLPPLESPRRPFADYEAQLTEHERQLAQLREVNEQLVLAALDAREFQAAAEHALRRQIAFWAVAAHELRNPLTPIRTAAFLLGVVRPEELPGVQATIERQVAHMSRLVGDLVDVSRVNTGKLRLERETVEMAGIINAAVDACRPAMQARLQSFSVHVPLCALEVHGDPVRLTQILSNLLENASKYTPDRGEIRLSAAVLDGLVVMALSDTGIGITTEVLPDIFELFVQGTHAIGLNGSGLGIGLTVVRELVEAHGGTVVATSAGVGLGSQFVVTLPLTVKCPETQPAVTPCDHAGK